MYGLYKKLERRVKCYIALFKAREDNRKVLDRSNFNNLLVLCYGNIYRSPFVGILLAEKFAKSYNNITVKSAGFHPKENRKSPEPHIKMCKNVGVDLENHRSLYVNKKMLDWADLIVIMDRFNWDKIRMLDSNALEKVVWLGAFENTGPIEIKDPYGCTENRAQEILEQLRSACDMFEKALLNKLHTGKIQN